MGPLLHFAQCLGRPFTGRTQCPLLPAQTCLFHFRERSSALGLSVGPRRGPSFCPMRFPHTTAAAQPPPQTLHLPGISPTNILITSETSLSPGSATQPHPVPEPPPALSPLGGAERPQECQRFQGPASPYWLHLARIRQQGPLLSLNNQLPPLPSPNPHKGLRATLKRAPWASPGCPVCVPGSGVQRDTEHSQVTFQGP